MILIIDDDYSVTASLGLLLKQAGHQTVSASNPDEALRVLGERDIALILQDMNFSRATTGEEGLALLARLRASHAEIPVILITAWGSIELAVAGMRAGAADFITKPWSNEQIVQAVETILGLAASRASATAPGRLNRAELDERYELTGIIGEEQRFLEVLELIGRVSHTDASVLITGDSGTGKEVIAEAIHRNSPRRDGPFIKVNLGGIATSLFESEMFGHVRGAFTDALRDRQGRFARANGGTILLDEIGDLDLRCQVKLLRVLQDRTYEILGSSVTHSLDVRVVSATNRDLHAAVETGDFREDLLYRLNLISVQLPSLAERPGDIPLLAQCFLTQAGETYTRPGVTLGDSAVKWLRGQQWPGNIRQMKQFIERSLLVTEGTHLEAGEFERVRQMETGEAGSDSLPAVGSMTVDELEKAMILKSLAHHQGNLTRVAESLGLSRGALYRRLEKHGIKP